MTTRDLWLRLRAILFRQRAEQELQNEIQSHLEMQGRKNLSHGMSESEARREALTKFGAIVRISEDCRDQRRIGVWDTILQDIRYALRGFRRSPTFVLAVTGTIGIGLGVNAAVFTVFNAYVLRPFPVRDSSSLYEVATVSDTRGGFSWNEYLEFPREHPFSEISGYTFIQTRMDGRDVRGQFVTGNYFQMLGVNPYLGRFLTPVDSAIRNDGAVAVLSYEIWRSRYGGDPNFVGKDVTLNGQRLQVVGIANPGFLGVGQMLVDLWIPMTMEPLVLNGRDIFGPKQPRSIVVVGRLIPRVDAATAKREITLWAQGLARITTNPAIREITMVRRARFQ